MSKCPVVKPVTTSSDDIKIAEISVTHNYKVGAVMNFVTLYSGLDAHKIDRYKETSFTMRGIVNGVLCAYGTHRTAGLGGYGFTGSGFSQLHKVHEKTYDQVATMTLIQLNSNKITLDVSIA